MTITVLLVSVNGVAMHPGWLRTKPRTKADVVRVRRRHPEWFVEDASPWWVLPGAERTV